MADPPPDTNSRGDAGGEPDLGSTTGTPRWVKVFGIIALAAIVLLAILLLSGRGHGPGRHMSGGAGGLTPAFSVMEPGGPAGHAPPWDDHR